MEQPIRLERDAIDFAVIESDSYGLYEEAVVSLDGFSPLACRVAVVV